MEDVLYLSNKLDLLCNKIIRGQVISLLGTGNPCQQLDHGTRRALPESAGDRRPLRFKEYRQVAEYHRIIFTKEPTDLCQIRTKTHNGIPHVMHKVRSHFKFARRDRLIQDRDMALQLLLLLVGGDKGLMLKPFHVLGLRSTDLTVLFQPVRPETGNKENNSRQ